jgi:fatty-acid desaturase
MSNAIRSPLLIAPLFRRAHISNEPRRKPSLSEIFREWLDAINFIKYPARFLICLNLLFHVITGINFVLFLFFWVSTASLIFSVISVVLQGQIYHTFWYHRYCSHVAFSLKNVAYARFLLWTNPIVFREECYAIPHRIHHLRTETSEDPYGPLLGYIGSYLAIESSQKINLDLSESEYGIVVKSLNHIGIIVNNRERFRKTGSIENIYHYLARSIFAQLFWAGIAYLLGGIAFVFAWYGSVFIITFLIRDFNWRGHGGKTRRAKKTGWEFDGKSYALNQQFYGYLASEWHDNHHKYPFSANNGFLSGQIDTAFLLIKLLYRLGIVESYVDAKPLFEKECLGISSTGETSVVSK